MDLKRGWSQKVEGGFLAEGGQREEKGLLSKLRLKKQEFLYIIKNGICRRRKGFLLYLLKNEKDGFGVSISKKIKGSVTRHKIIRRLRELYWKNRMKIPPNTKIVIVIKGDIPSFSYQYLKDTFLSIIYNLGDKEV